MTSTSAISAPGMVAAVPRLPAKAPTGTASARAEVPPRPELAQETLVEGGVSVVLSVQIKAPPPVEPSADPKATKAESAADASVKDAAASAKADETEAKPADVAPPPARPAAPPVQAQSSNVAPGSAADDSVEARAQTSEQAAVAATDGQASEPNKPKRSDAAKASSPWVGSPPEAVLSAGSSPPVKAAFGEQWALFSSKAQTKGQHLNAAA